MTRRQRRVITKEPDMKVKTKVKAGPRDCGGGGPIAIDPGI